MWRFGKAWKGVVIAGAALTAIASIPEWFTLVIDPAVAEATGLPRRSTRGGLVGDGALTLVLAALAVGLLLNARRNGTSVKTGVLTSLCGFVTVLAAGVTYRDAGTLRSRLATIAGTDGFALDVHSALWLVFLGGALLLIAGVMAVVEARSAADATSEFADRE